MSHAQLAAACDLTEAEVAAQIASMESEKFILGYKALVDWEKTADETVTALIEVHVTPQSEKGYDRIAERIYQYPEVENMYLISGGYDFMVMITGHTLKQVALFVSQKLAPIEGVTGTATHFILKKYKEKSTIFQPRQEQTERPIFV
jgi:DNA-binding Lrp family transcriptional regulator